MSSKFLCRFRPDSQLAIEAALSSDVYAVSPNHLNDVNDCAMRYDLFKLKKKLLNSGRNKDRLIEKAFLNDIHIRDFQSYKEYEEEYERRYDEAEQNLFDTLRSIAIDKAIEKEVIEVVCRFRDSFGVVCFSESSNSQIMWSHYASDSRGFLLIYDYENLKYAVNDVINKNYPKNDGRKLVFGLHKVKYCSKKNDKTDFLYKLINKYYSRKIDSDPREFRDAVFDNLAKSESFANEVIEILTTKGEEWSYEKEHRIIFPFEDHSLGYDLNEETNKDIAFNIGKLIPNYICLGDKMSKANKAALGYYSLVNKRTLLCMQDRPKMLVGSESGYPIIRSDKILDE